MQPATNRAFWFGIGVIVGLVIAASAFYLGRPEREIAQTQSPAPTAVAAQKTQPAIIAASTTPGFPNQTTPDGTVLIFDGKETLSQLDRDLRAAGRVDIKSGIEFVNTHYPEAKRQRALKWLLVELAKDHLEAMLEILPLLTPEERSGALQLIAEYWAGNDIAAFRKFVNTHFSGAQKNDVYRNFAHVLARKGLFEESIATLHEMPISSSRTQAATDITWAYTAKDPIGAVQWVATLETKEERVAAQRALLSSLGETGNVEAMKAFLASAPDSMRGSILQEIGKVMGKTSASALTEDPLVADNEKDRGYLLMGAVSTAPRADMPTLGKQLAKIPDLQTRFQATADYVGRLFEMDPQQAIGWVNSAPQETREVAVKALTSSWYRTDAQAAVQWVNALPNGRDRDWALQSLTQQFIQDEPDRAMEFAVKISDERIRNGLIHNVNARRR